jgi:hypothetical protein
MTGRPAKVADRDRSMAPPTPNRRFANPATLMRAPVLRDAVPDGRAVDQRTVGLIIWMRG